MNALIVEIVLMLVRHGLTAVGLERLLNDSDFNVKVAAGVAAVVGIAMSAARKIKRQSKEIKVNHIPQVPPAAVLVFGFVLCVGCVDTRVKLPNGAEFTTKRFLWPGKITSATISTNGSMTIQGYQSDPDKVINAVSEGVVNGLRKGALIP